jgi:glucosylceramidase
MYRSRRQPGTRILPPLQGTSISIRDQRYQRVLGFGAALTDASCYLLEQLDARKRKTLLDECFGPSGSRFSIARTTIGSSDYSLSAYSY